MHKYIRKCIFYKNKGIRDGPFDMLEAMLCSGNVKLILCSRIISHALNPEYLNNFFEEFGC